MPTRSVLWDTSVVIDPVDGDDLVAVSIVTVLELVAGVNAAIYRGDRQLAVQRQQILADTLAVHDPLPLDGDVVASYARLDAAVREVGRQPRRRLADLQIAATAAAYGLALVTRHPGDFAGLPIEIIAPG